MESYQGEATGRLGESYFVENGWRATKGRLLAGWERVTLWRIGGELPRGGYLPEHCEESYLERLPGALDGRNHEETTARPEPELPYGGYRDIPCRAILGRLPNDCLESYIGQIAEVLGEGLLCSRDWVDSYILETTKDCVENDLGQITERLGERLCEQLLWGYCKTTLRDT